MKNKTHNITLAIDEEIAPYQLSCPEKQQKVEEVLKCLRLSGEQVYKIGEIFLDEMLKGIQDKPSSLLMENTYVPELLDGSEEGEYLALDLGGTNFRVLLLHIKHGSVVGQEVEKFHISDELRVGCGLELFDYLAECLAHFVKARNLADKNLPMGFTFSFPIHHHSLNSGVLITWTKSFTATGVEGSDVVQMLKDAITRRGDIKVDVVAILNDTTGTLMQGSFQDKNTMVGLILGTGSNACYLERAENVCHWEAERHGEKEVIIDIEWGAFGDNGVIEFIRSDFDRQVDLNSLIVNSFTFEKYISGKYLGELVRVILVYLANQKLIFNGVLNKKIQKVDSFPTLNISRIEKDNVNDTSTETEQIFQDFDLVYSQDDIAIAKLVCELVSLRAAILVSTCLARLLKHMDRPQVTVAIDGSLYKLHPRFKNWMHKFVKILAPHIHFKLMMVEEGSGKGAGLTAAIARKICNRNIKEAK